MALEPRSLAAPAFWRLAGSNDTMTVDHATAQAASNTAGVTNTNGGWNTGNASAVSNAVSADGSTTFTMTGVASTQVTDLADPGTGALIGNYAISMSFSGQLGYVTAGPLNGVVNDMGVAGQVAREYFIADDSVNETTPVKLVEHFTVNFAPPLTNPTTIVMNASVGTSSGLTVNVTGGANGVGQVQFTSPATMGTRETIFAAPGITNSGTITPFFGPPGDSIAYSVSTSSVNITSTLVAGPYGEVTRNAAGNPTGAQFNVLFNASMQDVAASDPGHTDQATLTAGYDAHFS